MRLLFLFICFLSLFSGSIFSGERIISSQGGVDLVEVDKLNDEGRQYASDYYAYNRGQLPVYVSIPEVQGINIENKLITGTLVVDPNQPGYLGWIEQRNPKQGSSWKVEWKVEVR